MGSLEQYNRNESSRTQVTSNLHGARARLNVLQANTPPSENDQGADDERINDSFWATISDQVGSNRILGTILSNARPYF